MASKLRPLWLLCLFAFFLFQTSVSAQDPSANASVEGDGEENAEVEFVPADANSGSTPGIQKIGGAPELGGAELPQSSFDAKSYSFNPLEVKRDPFKALDAENAGKLLNDLERYDLAEMKLVAILKGMGAAQAMVVLPNNKSHILKKGDRVGRRNGVVEKIAENEVLIRESFRDFQNRIKTDLTSLVLAD